jgi:hypothetical protein
VACKIKTYYKPEKMHKNRKVKKQNVCIKSHGFFQSRDKLLIKHHIGLVKQMPWKFFEATRVFDPRAINIHKLFDPRLDSGRANVATHDRAQHKAVPSLMQDMLNQKPLEEWSIYIAQGQAELQQYMNVVSNAVEPSDIIEDIVTIEVLI